MERLAHQVYDAVTPIEKAKRLGTYKADDRSRQYPIQSSDDVIAAVNLALTKARRCERLSDEKDAHILNLQAKLSKTKLMNILLTVGIVVLWEVAKFLIELQLR